LEVLSNPPFRKLFFAESAEYGGGCSAKSFVVVDSLVPNQFR
jgi:hypothetical protein